MKSLFLSIALCAATSITAQTWCPPGAEWHYQWYDFTEFGSVRVNCLGETTVGGHVAQRLETVKSVYLNFQGSTQVGAWITYYTRSTDDLVSLWNGTDFDTLYVFGAAPGTHWSVPGTDQPVQVTVVDTGTLVLQGLPLRFSVVDYHPSYGIEGDTLVERLGSRKTFFDPFYTFRMDGPGLGLRCYSDGDIAFSADTVGHCALFTAVEDLSAAPSFHLYSDGADLHVRALDVGPGFRLELRDLQGRMVHQQRSNGDRLRVPVGALPVGLYLYRIFTGEDGRKPVAGKWMKG